MRCGVSIAPIAASATFKISLDRFIRIPKELKAETSDIFNL